MTDVDDDGDDEGGPPAVRPDAIRVGRRALALYAVANRAAFERHPSAETASEFLDGLHAWIVDRDLDDELEPAERDWLAMPIGGLDLGSTNTASWRIEGAAVLAWALSRMPLPSVDQAVTRDAVGDALFAPLPWSELQLRPAADITRLESVLYNLNWRVCRAMKDSAPQDVRRLLHHYLDPLPDAEPVPFAADDDLAVGGVAFTSATADDQSRCRGTVLERRPGGDLAVRR